MKDFFATHIDEILFKRIKGKSYKENCALSLTDLRYIHILHKNIDGNTKTGELIANAYIARDLLDIFQKLYEANYPIESVRLIDEYDADDELSMRANNSSAFNFRTISHTNIISKHGLGLAVDINPLYNPYVKEVDGKRVIEPATAEPYLDRDGDFPYKIVREDICCKLFLSHNFEWGGDWVGKKDYQHFEISDDEIARLYDERYT